MACIYFIIVAVFACLGYWENKIFSLPNFNTEIKYFLFSKTANVASYSIPFLTLVYSLQYNSSKTNINIAKNSINLHYIHINVALEKQNYWLLFQKMSIGSHKKPIFIFRWPFIRLQVKFIWPMIGKSKDSSSSTMTSEEFKLDALICVHYV